MSEANVAPIFHRQSLIEGWDQAKWSSVNALVIGDGNLSQHVSDALVGMGVKSLMMVGNRVTTGKPVVDGFLTYESPEGAMVVNACSELLQKVNGQVKVDSIPWSTRGALLETLVADADLVFETTNDRETKRRVLDYTKKHDKFLVSGASGKYKGAFWASPKDVDVFSSLHGNVQGGTPSLVISGFMVEEARKHVMRYSDNEPGPYQDVFWYNICSNSRFSEKDDYEMLDNPLSGKRILLGGAGALGMPVAIALMEYEMKKLGILDYESPDATNIARQTLYYDCIGKKKATSLREKVMRMNPGLDVKAHQKKLVAKKVEENEIAPNGIRSLGYDFAVRCFDNFAATVVLNTLKRPVIYGGTSYSTASVTAYVPGKTSCLDCTMHASMMAEDELDRDSCDNVPEPSIITTSKIAAGMMAGEALLVGAGMHENLLDGTIEYSTYEPMRVGTMIKRELCRCS
jgi:molybdopterin/thiamine biosynthesis adenylyltransferase